MAETDKKYIFVPSGWITDLNDKDWIEFLGHDAGEFITEEEFAEIERLIEKQLEEQSKTKYQ